MRHATVLFLGFSAAVAACSAGEEGVRSAVADLQSETYPSEGVRFMYRGYVIKPELTLASYAVAGSAGSGFDGATPASSPGLWCTGTMIGPNVFMTAGHCGFNDDRLVRFTFTTAFGAADAQGRAQVRSLQWPSSCQRLVQSFADGQNSDLALFYCPNDATGLGPGDIYGWLDFDQAQVSVNQPVQSVFTTSSPSAATSTPLFAPSVPWATPQYGVGQVVLNAQQACSATDPPVLYDIPGEPGNSGAPALNSANWRVAVGPLSVVGSSSCGTYSGRWARSMWDYVQSSRVRTGLTPSHIASANVTALGLTPSNYASAGAGTRLDGDGDFVFDLQADLERARGENARDWVFLGFDSPRRNALWDRNAVVSFVPQTGNGYARVTKPAAGYVNLLRHRRLNLAPNTTYRISVMTATRAQGSSTPLSIGLCSMVGGVCQYSGNRFLATQAGATTTSTVTGTTSASATAVYLDVDAHASYDGDLLAVSVVRTNSVPGSATNAAVMDFDTHDKRFNWRNDITGARAVLLPDGETTQAGSLVMYADGSSLTPLAPDWALYVLRDSASPWGWPARNGQLALTAGRRYTVCFDHRRVDGPASTGLVRVQSWNGSAWVDSLAPVTFAPGAAWAHVCSTPFTVAGDASSMQFGFTGTPGAGQNYLVDELSIVESP